MTAGIEGEVFLRGVIDLSEMMRKSLRGRAEGKSVNAELLIFVKKFSELLIIGGEVFPEEVEF